MATEEAEGFKELFEAAKSGDVDKVREILLDCTILVNCTDSFGWTPLSLACHKGHLGVVRLLVSEFKVDMTIQTPNGSSPLKLAAICNHDNVVRALLSNSQCLVDTKDQDGYTALHYSCKYGYVDIVKTLVQHKANVNARTDSGDTPLTLAAKHGHDNIVQDLLSDTDCIMDAKDKDGYTALHYSCKYGHFDIMRALLIKYKAIDINATTDSGYTPLMLAAMNNHANVVHTLLSDSQCLVDAKSQDGYTALHYSCKYGHVDVVRTLLVKYKAIDVNTRTDSGDTPLTLAARHEHDNVVHALLSDSQCLVDTKDQDGYTALHYSCIYGYVDIVKTLVKHKANINARTYSGNTPLTLAAICNHDNVVHALLSDSQCLVDTKDQDGYTALHYSCIYGYVDIVKTLVKHKANINARTYSGNTPLTLAAICNHDNVVHALLSNSKCLVDAKGYYGFTALHVSCKSGNVCIMRTLVHHKADVNARTDCGDTPLTLASRHGHENVVHALLSDSQCLMDTKDQDSYTALHYSCSNGYVNITWTLVKHKANVNARTDNGYMHTTNASCYK